MSRNEGEKVKLIKYKIAGGNSTLLVEGCSEDKRQEVVINGLKTVEQVGFVDRSGPLPSLEMMGNELCINATIAFANLLGKSGQLLTSGLKRPVRYSQFKDETTVIAEFPVRVKENIVLLPGIGFVCRETGSTPLNGELEALAKQYDLPAFGLLNYSGNLISPWIYVAQTQSIIRETACGSGSVALNALNREKRILQPSGGVINVFKDGDQFTVSARVVKIGESRG